MDLDSQLEYSMFADVPRAVDEVHDETPAVGVERPAHLSPSGGSTEPDARLPSPPQVARTAREESTLAEGLEQPDASPKPPLTADTCPDYDSGQAADVASHHLPSASTTKLSDVHSNLANRDLVAAVDVKPAAAPSSASASRQQATLPADHAGRSSKRKRSTQPDYCRNTDVALMKHYNAMELAWSKFQKSHQERLRNLKEQIKAMTRDCGKDGRIDELRGQATAMQAQMDEFRDQQAEFRDILENMGLTDAKRKRERKIYRV